MGIIYTHVFIPQTSNFKSEHPQLYFLLLSSQILIFSVSVFSVCVFGCNFNSLVLNYVGHLQRKLHENVMPPMNELQSYEYQMFLVKGEIYWIRHNSELG